MTPLLSATLLRTQSDARLVALVRQGHERAFEAIVERYRRPLHRHIRRILPESRAEDAIQQTFLKTWSSLQEGAEISELRPWLYRIAQNTSLDALKRAGYDYDELSESLRSPGGPEADLDRRTVIRETLAGVAALPANQREALLRTAVGGDSRAQVAHDLGLTDGAVRQLLHRARTTLRAAATGLTPTPLAAWAAGAADGGPTAARLAELGAAGGAGAAIKAGVVVVAAGVLVTGPVALNDLSKHPNGGSDAAAATQAGHPPPAARWVANGGTGETRSAASGSATDGSGSGGASGGGRRRPTDRASREGSSGSGGSGSGEHFGSGRDGGGGSVEGEHGSTTSGTSGGDGHSGSGTSGSDDHSTLTTTSTSGSGTSGSGSSGGGDSLSGSGMPDGGSGSTTSGSGSEGPGSGELLSGSSGRDGSSETTTTTTTTTSH